MEYRTGLTFGADSPLWLWAFRHAGWILTRFGRRRDTGTTPNAKFFCKQNRQPLLMFAEHQWLEGLWIGRDGSTDEHLVASGGGIVRCRAVKPVGGLLHALDPSNGHPGLLNSCGCVGTRTPLDGLSRVQRQEQELTGSEDFHAPAPLSWLNEKGTRFTLGIVQMRFCKVTCWKKFTLNRTGGISTKRFQALLHGARALMDF